MTVTLLELFDAVVPDPAGGYTTTPAGEGFLFGGLTMSLALRAAAHTTGTGFVPRSLHCTFVRAGTWGSPLHFAVETTGDGRTVVTRQVTITEGGRTLATMATAFHRPPGGEDDGAGWQRDDGHRVPGPDGVAPMSVWLPVDGLLEVRPLGPSVDGEHPLRAHPLWSRVRDPLGDDPVAHACGLTFISDYLVIMAMHDSSTVTAEPGSIRTLDHSVWFHRRAHTDDWLLYRAEAVSVSPTHGVSQGAVIDRDGRRIATFVQGDIMNAHPARRPR